VALAVIELLYRIFFLRAEAKETGDSCVSQTTATTTASKQKRRRREKKKKKREKREAV
jgi:hypothetical protein